MKTGILKIFKDAVQTELSIELIAARRVSAIARLTTSPAATIEGRQHEAANIQYRSSCQIFFDRWEHLSANSNAMLSFIWSWKPSQFA
jgi:hypothetical protein